MEDLLTKLIVELLIQFSDLVLQKATQEKISQIDVVVMNHHIYNQSQKGGKITAQH